jgi:ATP-dependent helicase/DNAse subunit B
LASTVRDEAYTEQVRNAVAGLRLLDELDLPPSQADFHDLAAESLEHATRPMVKFQHKGPAVLDLMAARGIPFGITVIPGNIERSFPPAVRQDAILLDHERAAINRSLGVDGPGPLPLKARRRLDEERLLFRLSAGSARRKVIFTYPRIEVATARERLPSSFLLSAVQCFSGEQVDFSSVERFQGFERIRLSDLAPRKAEDCLNAVESDLAGAIEALRERDPGGLEHLRERSPFFRWAVELEEERWGKKVFTCYDGCICDPKARLLLRSDHPITERTVSPTRLETYATCPFQYFLSTVLRIEPIVEPEKVQRISPLDKGELIHLILWEFLTRLKNQREPPFQVEPGDADLLHDIANARFDEFERMGITGYPALWALDKERILSCLDGFLEEETRENAFRPTYFEVRYGMRAADPYESEISTEQPVSLRLGKRQVYLRGRIDRIDISTDGRRARVIDYKTGKAYARENDFGGGKSLQLPLYLLAASQLLEEIHPGIEIEESEYYHLAVRGNRRHIRFDFDALEAEKGALEHVVDTICGSVDMGLFFAVPGKYCKNCNFLEICGSQRLSLFGLKKADAKARAYLSLGGEDH